MFSLGALTVLVQIVFGILLSEGIYFVCEIVLRVDMSFFVLQSSGQTSLDGGCPA